MKVDTTRFSTLEVDEGSVIHLLRGPLGFEEYTDYVLVPHSDTRFSWMQCLTERSLAFIVMEPAGFFSNYEIDLPERDAERLGLTAESDAMVLSILTFEEDGSDVTANLVAPIVINRSSMRGIQAILQDNHYSTRHSLMERVEQEPSGSRSLQRAA